MGTYRSVETKYMEDRAALLGGMRNLDRREFLKVSAAALGATAGLAAPHSFTPVSVAQQPAGAAPQPAAQAAASAQQGAPANPQAKKIEVKQN